MGKTIPLSPDQGLYEGIRRYGAQQQRSADLANASTDAMLQNAVRAKEAPEQDYRRYRAKGKADIANYKDAEAAGLPVGGGKQAGVPSLRKSSFDFRRGLQEGGITNNVGLAAFMAHAQSESQFNPLAARVTEKENSHGIMQTNKERNTARVNWIKENGGQPDDSYWQGRYAAWENTEGPEKAYNVNNARTLQEANNLLARSQRYDPPGGAAQETSRRFVLAQKYFKNMAGEKPGSGPASAEGPMVAGADGETPQEFPHTDPKTGKKFKYAYLNDKQIEQAKQNHAPGMDRLQMDFDAQPDKKTGRVPYRIYDPNPTTAVPEKTPVPVVTEPVPVPVPGQQAALPAQAQAPVQPVVQPVPGGEDTENVAPTEGF